MGLFVRSIRSIFIMLTACILANCASIHTTHDLQLQQKCHQLKGEMVSSLACPTSMEQRDGEFCLVAEKTQFTAKAPSLDMIFFNGCTAGVADYDAVFFESCYTHDLCYHHEPVTNGKTKTQCDFEFYQNMKQQCENRDDQKRCLIMAKLFFEGVEHFGEQSWNCSNTLNSELIIR